MDRNENGFPRATRGGSSGGRDCTGNMRNSGNGSVGGVGDMNGSNNGWGCGPESVDGGCVDCLDTKPLAYSYNPIQRWQMLYTVDKALGRGTLFEELDKPLGVYGDE